MQKDPFLARESANYENPVPSREFILELLQSRPTPASFEELCELLKVDEERHFGLKRRLRAMERDGQVIFTRQKTYGLPERMDLLKGRVIGHRDGYGFLHLGPGERDLFIPAHQMQSLFHGDEVLAKTAGLNKKGRREVRIVRVYKSRSESIVGRYKVEHGLAVVTPDDTRICQDIFIPPEAKLGAKNGQMVVIELTQRPSSRMNAVGKVVEVLGEHMAPGMEIEIALRNHDLPHQWPQEVLEQVKRLKPEVPESAKKGRVDLRHLPLVTIDGEDARDFDDAVYCETKKSGGWRLWVAIADVSHYVRTRTALDEEAINRGNSVYFPEQVIPMLPEILSNGLCSLNPKVDRLCMVCEMTISAAGKMSGYKFYEAVMHSHARFTYTQVGAILEGDKALRQEYADLVPYLTNLHQMYKALKASRARRGAVEFETVESKFVFNSERKIEAIVPVVRNDAHKLIEESMILANVAAAKILEKHKMPGLYRVHEKPDPERLENFRQFLGELGIESDIHDEEDPKAYTALLRKVAERPDAELIQTMLLRSMKQAVYQDENIGHFGLALPAYAHFTSPIRRYPDLVVHRAIKAIVQAQGLAGKDGGAYKYSEEQVQQLGEHCSMTERRADDATRDVADWLKCEFMLDHVGDSFDGVVSSVTSFGLFVRLDDFHIDGLVHISALDQDYYEYDEARQRLIGERSGKIYSLGERMQVQVAAVNLDERKIDFVLDGNFVAKPKPTRKTPESRGKSGRSGPGLAAEKDRRERKKARAGEAKKARKKSKKSNKRPGKNARVKAKKKKS